MDENTMIVALSGQICGTLLLISLVVGWISRRKRNALPTDGLQRIEGRLAEMQQSLDAVAVEVERISEGQRFTSKLLAERGTAQPAELNGVPEPVRRNAAR
jgi:hypothetical protein